MAVQQATKIVTQSDGEEVTNNICSVLICPRIISGYLRLHINSPDTWCNQSRGNPSE